MQIVLTGVSGFVGARLLEVLAPQHQVTAVTRRPIPVSKGVSLAIADLTQLTQAPTWLKNQDCVIHCAALAHVVRAPSADTLAEYRRINTEATLNLARYAVAAGVKRFIFLSSIKVNGEATTPNHPYTAADQPAPVDAYGQSKWEAEQALQHLATTTGLEVVIIRPVLVYGPGVKANMRRLMSWIDQGWPLPLARIHNRRSLLALDNLVDLIRHCLQHPKAAHQIWLASDGEDLSTPELIRRLAQALNRPARLIPVPPSALQWLARCFGQQATAQRLCGSLQVDIRPTYQQLNWSPPLSVNTALQQMAHSFRGQSDR